MAWRVLVTERGIWHVAPAVERRANAESWQLMFAFRAVDAGRTARALWAPYPLESVSKSTLYAQAEKIGDDELREVLAQYVS